MRNSGIGLALPALAKGIALLSAGVAAAENRPATKVYLNGIPTPVYFSDGDSFLVLGGIHKGSRARLAMFNTLEVHGPVHSWGTWTGKELYINSKKATLNARRGVWHCTGDLEKDTYGRLLWYCLDLAVDQVRKGLAHAMSITKQPARPELIEAQRQAIAEKRGMWSQGVPNFVLTSLHSVSEGRNPAYNRLVSTRDGHSEKMKHSDVYEECQKVCGAGPRLDPARLREAVQRLSLDRTVDTAIRNAPPAELALLVQAFVDASPASTPTGTRLADATSAANAAAETNAMRAMARETHKNLSDASPSLPPPSATQKGTSSLLNEDPSSPLQRALARYKAEGLLGNLDGDPGSCMVYVAFKRRYGNARAECLR
jgi:endonuclease YncB( thermonuclease family)